MDHSPPIPLTPSQVARRLNVTPARVRQLFAAGKLPFISTPLGRLVEPEALDRFINSRAERNDARVSKPGTGMRYAR